MNMLWHQLKRLIEAFKTIRLNIPESISISNFSWVCRDECIAVLNSSFSIVDRGCPFGKIPITLPSEDTLVVIHSIRGTSYNYDGYAPYQYGALVFNEDPVNTTFNQSTALAIHANDIAKLVGLIYGPQGAVIYSSASPQRRSCVFSACDLLFRTVTNLFWVVPLAATVTINSSQTFKIYLNYSYMQKL